MASEEKRLWNESFLINKDFIFMDVTCYTYDNKVYDQDERVYKRLVYQFKRNNGKDYFIRDVYLDYFTNKKVDKYLETVNIARVKSEKDYSVLEVDLSKVNVVKIPSYNNTWVFSYSGDKNSELKKLIQQDYDYIIQAKIANEDYYEEAKMDRKSYYSPGFINPKSIDYILTTFVEEPKEKFSFLEVGKCLYKIAKHKFFSKKK